jgi:ankyrin repeat protein
MSDSRTDFIKEAIWHGSLERANSILSEHPELRSSDIHTAAILGDDASVRRFLAQDSRNATATSAPYGGDALVYLCLSKYLRLDPSRSDDFLRAAVALLDSGANPSSGFWHKGEFETALYGAAGVAHHAPLTRLLLERGANPNDEEAVYHSPETRESDAMKALVETGKLTDASLALMLIRKIDWHDEEGVRYLLAQEADPNRQRERGWRALHHALARDNDLTTIDLLLDYGADPTLSEDGMSAIARAARGGRSDVLESLSRRGIPLDLHGIDRLIAACAMNDAAGVRSIAEREPRLVREVVRQSGKLLADFAGTGNTAGVRHLLDLGAEIGAVY